MIPIESEASFKKGSWFIHNDGINTIQIWSSNLNGKEKVFLNNELVSEQRSLKMQNSHKFKDKNGHNYEVEFKVINLFKGVLNCSIKKDGLVIKVFKTRFVIGLKNILKYLLILFLASFIFSISKPLFL